MNRRDAVLTGVAAIGASAIAGLANRNGDQAYAAPAANKIADTSAKCVAVGLSCLKHCYDELAKGNKQMAECAESVSDTIAVCEAIQKLARTESKNLKTLAKAGAEICKSCMQKCEPHAKHMEICKACMDACKECYDACMAA